MYAVSGMFNKCPRIVFDILGSSIEAGIDTQASINALKRETYLKMIRRPDLVQDNSIVFSFDGEKPLKSLGKFKAEIRVNDRSI